MPIKKRRILSKKVWLSAILSMILMMFALGQPLLFNAADSDISGSLPVVSHSDESSSQSADSSSVQEKTASTEEQNDTQITLYFSIQQNASFAQEAKKAEVVLSLGAALQHEQIPQIEYLEEGFLFEGWEKDGLLYNKDELLRIKWDADALFTARITEKAVSKQTASSANMPRTFTSATLPDSIAGIIQTADIAKVAVIPGTDGSAYQSYTANEAGLKEALYNLYLNGNGNDFILYMGSNLSPSTAGTHIGSQSVASPSATSIAFSSLKDSVGTLIITASTTDPTNSTATAPADAKTFSLATDVYFSTNIVLRNIRYNFSSVYMQGKNLTMDRGSYETGILYVYGGGNQRDITGNPVITVNATGLGYDYHFAGGNNNGGTLTGNTSIVINNTYAGIYDIWGGARGGSVNGDVSVVIQSVNGNVYNYYGAGYGTASVPANVTGSVNSDIRDIKGTLGAYYGGTNYGNIGGGIVNKIVTTGGVSGTFYGGSASGNIGQPLTQGAVAIDTDIDISGGSGMWLYYGTNQNAGQIYGDVDAVLTSGTGVGAAAGSAAFSNVHGGASSNGSGLVGRSTVDAWPAASRAANFAAQANIRQYGNITTELAKGNFMAGGGVYTTGAGQAGYVEGNVTIKVGTQGLAHSSATGPNAPLTYTTSNTTRGEAAAWDITGGGGVPGDNINGQIYIKGDTRTELYSAIAKWTYGGGYSGFIEGNTSIVIDGAIVDTAEGGGYNDARIWGNTSAYVYKGQVDWFLSGGGWNDHQIQGNAYVEVWDGVINASMAGTYGETSTHTVFGDAEIMVYGGNFSGTPRIGSNGFSGGGNNNGTVLGNTKVTLDLRAQSNPAHTQGGFVLPVGTYISGGRRYNATSVLGTSEQNTIELNIFTDPGSNVLNGANIYGDAGSSADNTKSGKITINIDAPGSTIGTLYATQYSNIGSGTTGIVRDVTANIKNASAIQGISGGSSTDNFTNTVYANSAAKGKSVAFNVGGDGVGGEIKITSTGMKNFFVLRINSVLLMAEGSGSILNGSGATAATHGTTYNNFGTVSFSNGGGIGISGTSPTTTIISAGEVIVENEARIVSPSGHGRVNISSLTVSSEESRINWIRNGGTALASSKGTWFGNQQAYQVLTFSPTVSAALSLTPFNFLGLEEVGKTTLIGDNDVSGTAYGYGIALEGSVVEFRVNEGLGSIMHDMDGVSQGPPPPTLSVAGSVAKEVAVQSGKLIIPLSAGLPTLTFTPDTASQSWVKQVLVTRSDGDIQTIGESQHSNPVTWQSPNGRYSYVVEVDYTNQVELQAQGVLIKESEAAAITNAEDIILYNKAEGRPFFTNNITQAMIEEINQPLADGEDFRIHPVTYTAGNKETPDNYMETTVNVVVVREKTILSPNRAYGLYAENATMTLQQAQELTGEEQLAADFTAALVISADGNTSIPVVDENAVASITGATQPKTVEVSYSFPYMDGEQEAILGPKAVTVQITENGVPFVFYKVDANDPTVKLEGAEFELYVCTNTDPAHTHSEVVTDAVLNEGGCWQLLRNEEDIPAISVSAADGKVDFGVLADGEYMLVESKAPNGYSRPVGQWHILVSFNAETPLIITAKGEKMPPAFGVGEQSELLLPNMRPFAIPTSGAGGIIALVAVGIILVGAAFALFIYQKSGAKKIKRQENRSAFMYRAAHTKKRSNP